MHNKLLIVASEPQKNQHLDAQLLNDTCGKKFSSQNLFSNQTQINIRGTTIVDSNHR